jgi:NADPH:quinone reductase-like Zn-dependent oxidoreductase
MSPLETMPMPESFDWAQAASVPVTFMVAHDMLVAQGQLKAGEWLMVNGVSSGVGTACVQLAHMLGAQTIGTSGSAEKLQKLKAHGLTEGIATRQADFFERTQEITAGKGVNLIVNTVGGSVLAEELRCLAYQGRLAIVGYVDGCLQAPLNLDTLHAQRLRIFGVSNRHRTPAERQAGVADFVTQYLPRFAQTGTRPLVDRVFAFDQLTLAKAYMQSDQQLGKIVLSVHHP